jgi:hypothetical protein
MKRFITMLVALIVVGFSGAALAQDGGGGEEPRSKFYDFNDMMVDGELQKPKVQRAEARGSARFERLLDLKKSFLPKVQQSAKEDALQ